MSVYERLRALHQETAGLASVNESLREYMRVYERLRALHKRPRQFVRDH